MDTSEFFNTVVRRNYQEFTSNPDDFRLLWNAIISMNSVPEYMALDQHGYAATVSRDALARAASQIRNKDQSLKDVKFCADALKHVRKIPPKSPPGAVTVTVTSTIVSPINRTTWIIGPHDLTDVAQRAFSALSALML
jgi:hypothetical protein